MKTRVVIPEKLVHLKFVLSFAVLLLYTSTTTAQVRDTVYLWNGQVPGETEVKHSALRSADSSGNVIRLTDVTNPSMIVFEPDGAVKNGAGVIICPGGGYYILAIDKEGYEIAEWLNTLGYTAFVLQYRVPKKQDQALYDVQRALRLVRGHAATWGIETGKLGVIGFSAGGSLSARASTRYNETTYPKTDDFDSLSSRPDFAVLIYPAYLDQGENRSLTPELSVDRQTPPMFIFGTADDKYGNSSLVMATALRDHQVPVELHFYSEGGHGYGLRPGNSAAEAWPTLASKWLEKFALTKK